MSVPYEDEVERHFDIRLAGAEALVLFDLLSRWGHDGAKPSPDAACFESPAECVALMAVLAHLEEQLVAPFRNEYEKIIERARARLAEHAPYISLRELRPDDGDA